MSITEIVQKARIPFSVCELTFDYSRIEKEYWASNSPHEQITLYKAAPEGYELKGLRSLALHANLLEKIIRTKRIIESGDDRAIWDLLDKHTSYHEETALLSASYYPETAQVFAPTAIRPTREKKPKKTIYQIKIMANRCIVDYFDTGRCGANKELVILGAIFPEEITAVKIINDDEHSELYDRARGRILNFPHKNSYNRAVKDPTNWRYLR